MTEIRLNAYRIMWLFVFFDLPVKEKKQRRRALQFRKNLEKDGFTMKQFSVYIRHCGSKESEVVHRNRIQKILPSEGAVSMYSFTDKQYSEGFNFYNVPPQTKKTKKEPKDEEYHEQPMQLELF